MYTMDFLSEINNLILSYLILEKSMKIANESNFLFMRVSTVSDIL